MERSQLQDEVAALKGRGANIKRELDMHYNEMNKLNQNSNSATEHARILQDRLTSLEEDLENMRAHRNECQEEARRAN